MKSSVLVMPPVYIAEHTKIPGDCVNPVTGCKNTKSNIAPMCYCQSEINTCEAYYAVCFSRLKTVRG